MVNDISEKDSEFRKAIKNDEVYVNYHENNKSSKSNIFPDGQFLIAKSLKYCPEEEKAAFEEKCK